MPDVLLAALRCPHVPASQASRQMKDWLMEHGHEADVWALVQVRALANGLALLLAAFQHGYAPCLQQRLTNSVSPTVSQHLLSTHSGNPRCLPMLSLFRRRRARRATLSS